MSAATTRAAPATPAKATALPLGTPAAYAAEVLGTFVLVLFIIVSMFVGFWWLMRKRRRRKERKAAERAAARYARY